VGDNQGRALYSLNDIRNRKGLAGTGHTQQNLVSGAFPDTFHETFNGLGLIAPGFKLRDHFKAIHEKSLF
jgi:hypothetical protein